MNEIVYMMLVLLAISILSHVAVKRFAVAVLITVVSVTLLLAADYIAVGYLDAFWPIAVAAGSLIGQQYQWQSEWL